MGSGCTGTANFCEDNVYTCSTVTFQGPECTGYRLPTEAEWEYSARAGTTTATYAGNLLSTTGCALLSGAGGFATNTPLADIAWYQCNNEGHTRPAGTLAPNPWGLRDVFGNVNEWVWNWYEESHTAGLDPLGPATGSERVWRGASHFHIPSWNRAAFRRSNMPNLRWQDRGFRLVRTAPVDPDLDCSFPSTPDNGDVALPDGTTGFGATATYSCDPGFVLVGDETRLCIGSGEWTGEVPVCAPEVDLGEACFDSAQCPDQAWCPTDGGLAVCSPSPVFGGDTRVPFLFIPDATFTKGSPVTELGRNNPVETLTPVTLSRSTFVQRTPLTQGQWRAVITAYNSLMSTSHGTDPAWHQANGTCAFDDCPVERVNWYDAVYFANAMSILEGLQPCYTLSGCTGSGQTGVGGGCGASNWCDNGFWCTSVTFEGVHCEGYRLPTEAEWEFAARAGTTTATYAGNLNEEEGCVTVSGIGDFEPGTPLGVIARYACIGDNRTQRVAFRSANAFGFFDMLGNVFEWNHDNWQGAQSGGTDPTGPATGSSRTRRGGSFANQPNFIRAAYRGGDDPTYRTRSIGFRLVRSADPD